MIYLRFFFVITVHVSQENMFIARFSTEKNDLEIFVRFLKPKQRFFGPLSQLQGFIVGVMLCLDHYDSFMYFRTFLGFVTPYPEVLRPLQNDQFLFEYAKHIEKNGLLLLLYNLRLHGE